MFVIVECFYYILMVRIRPWKYKNTYNSKKDFELFVASQIRFQTKRVWSENVFDLQYIQRLYVIFPRIRTRFTATI